MWFHKHSWMVQDEIKQGVLIWCPGCKKELIAWRPGVTISGYVWTACNGFCTDNLTKPFKAHVKECFEKIKE